MALSQFFPLKNLKTICGLICLCGFTAIIILNAVGIINWSLADFIVALALGGGFIGLYLLLSTKITRKLYLILLALGMFLAFILIWIALAVNFTF